MWQESQENKPPLNTSDMIELSFSVDCKELPYDHAFELSSEILNLIPEIKNDKRNAIQTLHGPMSGNGWVRPDGQNIPLSKRAKLIMRINKSQIDHIKT
ncbi:MAG: type I-MYXAN CRISPR-associated protein Cas6/Cmx6, partial [Gammaproteobacteria bacterium]